MVDSPSRGILSENVEKFLINRLKCVEVAITQQSVRAENVRENVGLNPELIANC